MKNTLFLICLSLIAMASHSAEIAGTVKTVKGQAYIERAGKHIPVSVGSSLYPFDRLISGPSSSVGVTLSDSTMLTAGPNSTIELNQYAFDRNTRAGRMDTSVKRGTVAIVSGQIAKANPEQVVFRTPTVTLGVRGTEFIIDVDAETKSEK